VFCQDFNYGHQSNRREQIKSPIGSSFKPTRTTRANAKNERDEAGRSRHLNHPPFAQCHAAVHAGGEVEIVGRDERGEARGLDERR